MNYCASNEYIVSTLRQINEIVLHCKNLILELFSCNDVKAVKFRIKCE